jgi:aspartokinase-like uncharacterized kinase
MRWPCSGQNLFIMPTSEFETSSSANVVVKVGGSLLDLPDLGFRLQGWLEELATPKVLLVPGGGPIADAVRLLQRFHQFDEEAAHWLAVRAMSLCSRVLATVLGQEVTVVQSLEACQQTWRQGTVPIIDVYDLLARDEDGPDHLPHSWSVTSDSVAARIALLSKARTLILLKSVTIPHPIEWSVAARQGFVDDYFPKLADKGLSVRAVNLREWRTSGG